MRTTKESVRFYSYGEGSESEYHFAANLLANENDRLRAQVAELREALKGALHRLETSGWDCVDIRDLIDKTEDK